MGVKLMARGLLIVFSGPSGVGKGTVRALFADREELNLAYHFHDYSDGMNVHANNEDTYRIMGAYLGGRVSTQIRF